MASWDVFHTERMEVERTLTTEAIRARLADNSIRPDDLARPAGTEEGWRRIAEIAAFNTPEPPPRRAPAPQQAPPRPAPPPVPPAEPPRAKPPRPTAPPPVAPPIPTAIILDDLQDLPQRTPKPPPPPAPAIVAREDRRPERTARETPIPAAIVVDAELDDDDIDLEAYDPLSEDQEAADFNLAPRGGGRKEEDLDLAAMVDVAFQLIMFFLVTASTVYFKSLEIPPPDPEKKTAQQAPSSARPLDELLQDNILVEIDPRGQVMVDHEPIPADMMATKLRALREASGRTAMLLMADLTTPHKNAVLAYDAASAIGLEIKVGRPSAVDD